jgi:hypothetical protein
MFKTNDKLDRGEICVGLFQRQREYVASQISHLLVNENRTLVSCVTDEKTFFVWNNRFTKKLLCIRLMCMTKTVIHSRQRHLVRKSSRKSRCEFMSVTLSTKKLKTVPFCFVFRCRFSLFLFCSAFILSIDFHSLTHSFIHSFVTFSHFVYCYLMQVWSRPWNLFFGRWQCVLSGNLVGHLWAMLAFSSLQLLSNALYQEIWLATSEQCLP